MNASEFATLILDIRIAKRLADQGNGEADDEYHRRIIALGKEVAMAFNDLSDEQLRAEYSRNRRLGFVGPVSQPADRHDVLGVYAEEIMYNGYDPTNLDWDRFVDMLRDNLLDTGYWASVRAVCDEMGVPKLGTGLRVEMWVTAAVDITYDMLFEDRWDDDILVPKGTRGQIVQIVDHQVVVSFREPRFQTWTVEAEWLIQAKEQV